MTLDDCQWIDGAVAELVWNAAGKPPHAMSVGFHADGESTPSGLAGHTLYQAVAGHRPARQPAEPGTGVSCRFYWRDGAPGVECASDSELHASIAADALERFWQVDHDRHGGKNAAKWNAMAHGA